MRHCYLTLLCMAVVLPFATAIAQDPEGLEGAQRNEALERLLDDVRQQAGADAEINAERESVFSEEQADRRRTLEETRAELERQRARSRALRGTFDRNEIRLEELTDQLRVRTGDMGELFGIFRQVAAEVDAVIDSSVITAEYPQRGASSYAISVSEGVPAMDDLKALQTLLIEEIVFSSQVSRFETALNDVTGAVQSAPVVRIGAFNALSADGYLHMTDGETTLSVLPRQPARHYASSAREFFQATGGNASVAIDPSRGTLLSLVIQSPGIVRQMTYGGAIGYTIITIGVVGFLIAVWRLWSLSGTRRRVARQLDADSVDTGNPLGRVLAVAEDNHRVPVEILERKLDEAVMRETPSLERYQGIIKVIAGVAPLMGLLGTVVGMIRTFQTITLFGSGDPRLMADGISQALVTTVEGLVVAIPLVFLHALMTDRSRELIDILEEQSAGLVARHTEATG